MNLGRLLKKLVNNIVKPGREPIPEPVKESETQFSNQQKQSPMSMFNYGVGGNEVKVDANEAINEIQHNKTMLIAQLTAEDPVQPEAVTGLKTVEDVFRHFHPTVDLEMENADGQSVKESLKFGNLGDFTPKSIIAQSEFLNDLNVQQVQYMKIMKQLKTNKVLKNLLENEETKEALIQAIRQASEELQHPN